MPKTRQITIEIPESAAVILERVATNEYSTLQTFVQQRLAELVKFVSRPKPEAPAEEPPRELPGQYL